MARTGPAGRRNWRPRGFYISGHPLAKHAARLKELGAIDLALGIEGRRNGEEHRCRWHGHESAPDALAQRRPLGIATLQDMSGGMEALVFPEAFGRLEAVLKSGAPLLMRGRVNVEEAGTRIALQEAKPLDQLGSTGSGLMKVRGDLGTMDEYTLDELKKVFISAAGPSPSFLIFATPMVPRQLCGPTSVCAWTAQARCRRAEMVRTRRRSGDTLRARHGTVERKRDIEALEREVAELRRLATPGSSRTEVERLQEEVGELKREFYAHLGAWQRTQLARHPQRPYTLDLARLLFTDFTELHGDRCFGDDPAIVAGFANFHGRPIMVIGHQKGRDTKQSLARNFGRPSRKAIARRCA